MLLNSLLDRLLWKMNNIQSQTVRERMVVTWRFQTVLTQAMDDMLTYMHKLCSFNTLAYLYAVDSRHWMNKIKETHQTVCILLQSNNIWYLLFNIVRCWLMFINKPAVSLWIDWLLYHRLLCYLLCLFSMGVKLCAAKWTAYCYLNRLRGGIVAVFGTIPC